MAPDLSDYLAGWSDSVQLADANSLLDEGAVCAAVASLGAMFAQTYRPTGAVAASLDSLMAAEDWPVFSIQLESGDSLHIVWRNFEGEEGNDLVLRHGSGDSHLISSIEGHFSWPGLSWTECLRAAQGAVDLDPSRALLLMVPFVGDQLPLSAREQLASALAATGSAVHDLSTETILQGMTVAEELGSWEARDGVAFWTGMNSLRGGASSSEFRSLVARSLSAQIP